MPAISFASFRASRRVTGRRDLEVARSLGVALTVVVGPAAGLSAWLAFHMGLVETAALVFLISGWLGPRLMGLGWN